MSKKGSSDNFIKQAGFLAVAGILSRIIGLLYRSPLTAIIGDEGNAYYSTAYTIYVIILLVSSYSIPSAISKIISQRLVLGEYNNAHRIFKCALIYVFVVGGIASISAFILAPLLVEHNSVEVFRLFTPTIFLSGFLGVLRGYFQAHRTMLQTSISQILEQILNAAVSILAAYFLLSSLSSSDPTIRAITGAKGSALGTGVGVLIALIFMGFLYFLNRPIIKKRRKRDSCVKTLSYSKVFLIILSMVTPIILSTFIYNFSTSLNQTIYIKIMMHFHHLTEKVVSTGYGVFASKAVTLSNVPIAIASAVSASIIPAISASYTTKNYKEANQKIQLAMKTTMLISIPSAVGLFVFAKPILILLFPQKATIQLATMLLQWLSITVIFYAISTLSNAILQGIGKVNIPVINAIIALFVQTLVLVIVVIYGTNPILGLVWAAITYSFLMCILNGVAIKKYLRYKQDYLKTFIMPGVCATLMGLVAYLFYIGMMALIKNSTISLFLGIIVAILIYAVLLLATRTLQKQELEKLPFGRKLSKWIKL